MIAVQNKPDLPVMVMSHHLLQIMVTSTYTTWGRRSELTG